MPVISKITGAPFRFWCQKILPAVYDDSLSYYELLCKVVDYLNKVMEDDINVVNLVNELEEFVNNYFDNLDVQQEINNKLDAMAEDGSLLTVIEPYLQPVVEQLHDDYSAFTEEVNTTVEQFTSEMESELAEHIEDVQNSLNDMRSDISEQDNDISVMQSQMSNFIDSHSDIQTFTTLFESTEQNGGHYEGQTITLLDAYTDYTELDIYWSFLGDVRVTRVASADVLANGVVISWFADSPALQPSNPAPLNIPLMSLINGNDEHTALTISTAYAETWTGLSTDSAVRNAATTSTDYDAGSIIRIIGVEYQASAELTDIRVGAYGTTFPTAGDAVRELPSDIAELGKNLFYTKSTLMTPSDGASVAITDNSVTVTATDSRTYRQQSFKIDVRGIENITISCESTSGTGTPRIRVGDYPHTQWISNFGAGVLTGTVDVSDYDYVAVALYAVYSSDGGEGKYVTYNNFQVEKGLSPTYFDSDKYELKHEYNECSAKYLKCCAHMGSTLYDGSAGNDRLSAYESAALNGFNYGEVDVMFTSDLVPVACHLDVNNASSGLFTDGNGDAVSVTISETTYADLLEYNYCGEKIASIEQIAKLFKRYGMDILIDKIYVSTEATKVQALKDVLARTGMAKHTRWILYSSASRYRFAESLLQWCGETKFNVNVSSPEDLQTNILSAKALIALYPKTEFSFGVSVAEYEANRASYIANMDNDFTFHCTADTYTNYDKALDYATFIQSDSISVLLFNQYMRNK